MDKETLLQTYIDIETKTFVRDEKTKKLDEFINILKTGNLVLSLTDTAEIVNCLSEKNITIRQPLFLHVIYPVLTKEVDKDNVDAIKLMIRLFQYFGNYQTLTRDNRFSLWTLLMKGLHVAPYDTELLNLYEKKQRDYFEYTLHELPAGVLYDSNGATTEQCEDLLNELVQYEEVCKKLQLDRHELTDECKFYYYAYKDYLMTYNKYKGFADYLKQRHEEE